MTINHPIVVNPEDHYVPVFVPQGLLGSIHQFLANAYAGPGSGLDAGASPEVLPEAGDVEWSGTADERFGDPQFVATHLVPRSDTVREAAKYLARRPGRWTTSEEIAGTLGLEHGWNSLAGAFGAAGRYFANRDIGLPWDWTYETPDRRIRLKMPPEIAEVVLRAL
jgi:hypothetical protein